MFRKILIANRGEIAVRIIRACRDCGIVPVAVYSEPDRASLHVRLADEAYLLGPAPSLESYLDIAKVLDAAKRSGADAIHPGYGFLSENPAFADACTQAGISFIGPSADSIRKMGSKTSARTLLRTHGIPLVPGTFASLTSVEEAIREARILGYPVMIKASAGGGGKGMRFTVDEAHMKDDFVAAASEALGSFGDSSLYLEKLMVKPRHIEIQVLADRHGNVVHLGERECSIQRRHQKLFEESPSPVMDETLRSTMGEVAVRIVRAVGYEGAGTIEFLLDADRHFYFLEMNTRLQVEHPVTEAVTGIDIVVEQFRIASGGQLSLRQDQVGMRGCTMECRICAEDPARMIPSAGVIRWLQEPQGPGIRLDSGIYQGWDVSIHYDPLLAKLIAYGADRQQAIARMRRALEEYRITGLKTNLSFFLELLSDGQFLSGNTHTDLVEQMQRKSAVNMDSESAVLRSHALAAALAYSETSGTPSRGGADVESPWKLSGRPGFTAVPRR